MRVGWRFLFQVVFRKSICSVSVRECVGGWKRKLQRVRCVCESCGGDPGCSDVAFGSAVRVW